ncbi:hypothetical protein DAEQUDRAFT_242774 [Daedalea quercina L-15889]|uniref:Uncharacterized protein n=1 Tax=Daedalea quercina L-15889 TaxID=1314783 RepID=A0A165QS04_9APHY|nr:hypothetical protein DAEQUDRAFT_242774 [Daedalea quercina L-15889]
MASSEASARGGKYECSRCACETGEVGETAQGLQPIIDPTEAQRSAARAKVACGWRCAIAGISGSSLVNALHGLRNSGKGALLASRTGQRPLRCTPIIRRCGGSPW